jgi:hypothetical protein
VRPTFVVSTRFPADDSSLGYERSVTVSKAWEEATTAAAFRSCEPHREEPESFRFGHEVGRPDAGAED